MITFNNGVVQIINGTEFELMSHKWHNPKYNIIATNVIIDGVLNSICLNKNLDGKDTSITVFKFKEGEKHFYYSRNYAFAKIPLKYSGVVAKLIFAFNNVDFDSLMNPSKSENNGLNVNITDFKINNETLYCDFILRDSDIKEFLNNLKVYVKDNRDMQIEFSPDKKRAKVSQVDFMALRIVTLNYMASNKVTLTSSINLNNIPVSYARKVVIETFKMVDLNNRKCS